jgi:gas vesicle protein
VTTASDPDEIRRQTERTQANLSQNVDALTEKVTPGKIVERRLDRARDTATRLKDKVMGTNPLSSSSSTGSGQQHIGGGIRDTAAQAADRVTDTASTAASTVQDTASSAASTVQDAASRAAGAAQDTAATAAGAVRDAAATAAERLQQTPQVIRQQARGNPLAAGLIAFGAGWLVSSLLPASRREQDLADQAKQQAQQVAQEKVAPVASQVTGEVRENLREPAQQAVESVKSTAQDAGQTVVEEGKSAAQDVQGRAQDAAGTVRGSTTS